MIEAPEGVEKIASFMKSTIPADTNFFAMLGGSDQMADLRAALQLNELPTQMDDGEPLFSLNLDKLIVPEAHSAFTRKPNELDAPLMADWVYKYLVETGLQPFGDKRVKLRKRLRTTGGNTKISDF